MIRPLLVTALLLTSGAAAMPASAQSADEEIKTVVVYGKDPCPKSSGDEVVVCARRPETERYRIPESLRESPSPDSESWASKAEALEYVGESGIGSCSPVGPGGASGCMQQLINQAHAERSKNEAAQRKIP
jgi:hypothetical protein